jgi:AraC-like DNA-binding protein
MKRMPRKGTVRIGVQAEIPGILKSLGADPEEIFAAANIDMALFNDPDNVISFAARGHLLNVCAAHTGCEHLGLLVGQKGDLSTFGLIGHLARQASSVGAALRTLQRYFHLHAQGARIKTSVQGQLARLSYHIYEPNVEATSQVEDGAMAWGYNMLKDLCGEAFKLTSVFFLHRPPSDPRPYEKLFGAPLSFNSEHEGLYFHADFLDLPLERRNPDLERLLQKEVNRIQAAFHDDFLDHFQRVLHSVLWVRPASADEMAALFSISGRTLKRRLQEYGTNYRETSDTVKRQIACEVLENSNMDLADLANLLHYHDASSFIKAFRRWTGTTPARWRLQTMQ